jgi:hypothetical protein
MGFVSSIVKSVAKAVLPPGIGRLAGNILGPLAAKTPMGALFNGIGSAFKNIFGRQFQRPPQLRPMPMPFPRPPWNPGAGDQMLNLANQFGRQSTGLFNSGQSLMQTGLRTGNRGMQLQGLARMQKAMEAHQMAINILKMKHKMNMAVIQAMGSIGQ